MTKIKNLYGAAKAAPLQNRVPKRVFQQPVPPATLTRRGGFPHGVWRRQHKVVGGSAGEYHSLHLPQSQFRKELGYGAFSRFTLARALQLRTHWMGALQWTAAAHSTKHGAVFAARHHLRR